jgi:hypothetical protein
MEGVLHRGRPHHYFVVRLPQLSETPGYWGVNPKPLGGWKMKRIQKFVVSACLAIGLAIAFTGHVSAQAAEAQIGNDRIVGTWAVQDGKTVVILQYCQSGQGREIVIDQSSGFELIFLPFEYSLTTKTIRRNNLIAGLKVPELNQYEMPSSNRLKILNYTEGFSPIFQKQDSARVEGIWQRKDADGDVIEYIFAGGVLVKVQNGQPFAFGLVEVSGAVLILTEQVRYVSLGETEFWIPSTVPKESYQYQISGNTLSWTVDGRQYLFTRQ